MIKQNLKIFIRNLRKQTTFSIIAIGGLSLAMAGALLIYLFVDHELSYDNFHIGADRIYNMLTVSKEKNDETIVALTMPQLAPELRNVPGIKSICKFVSQWPGSITYNSHKFANDKITYADSGFSEVFSFNILKGNLKKTLSGVSSVAITTSYAQQLFGNNDPIGKEITIDNQLYVIETLIESPPSNSSINFEIIIPIKAIAWLDEQKSNEFHTYFLIDEKASIKNVLDNAKIVYNKLLKPREKTGYIATADVRQLLDIHLFKDNVSYELPGQGKTITVFVLTSLTLFILLIAVLNFANIFTSRSHDRIKEIGLRKTVGGSKSELIIQFLTESVLVSFIAAITGVLLALLLLDQFSILLSREITINSANAWRILLFVIFISLFVGLLAGFYPAFYISKLTPSNILSCKTNLSRKNKFMSGTVVAQFSIVIMMFFLVIVMGSQLRYLKNKDLGFNKDHLLVFDFNNSKSFDAFRNALIENPQVKYVTASQSVPGKINSGQKAFIEGEASENGILIDECRIQSNFIETYEMKIVSGRDFDKTRETDKDSVIINESAVKQFGLTAKNAIGKRLDYGRGMMTIIGVVKDYNYASLHKSIMPIVLTHKSKYGGLVTARLHSSNIEQTISFIKLTASRFDPQTSFKYFFIDESFRQMYRNEDSENTILLLATLIVITLAALGLVAFSSIAVVKRTKEVGIRKVLGARTSSIILLLSSNLIKFVILANFIALPISWYLGNLWLENFSYKITLSPSLLFLSGFSALILALGSITIVIIKAAIANPVESLKYE